MHNVDAVHGPPGRDRGRLNTCFWWNSSRFRHLENTGGCSAALALHSSGFCFNFLMSVDLMVFYVVYLTIVFRSAVSSAQLNLVFPRGNIWLELISLIKKELQFFSLLIHLPAVNTPRPADVLMRTPVCPFSKWLTCVWSPCVYASSRASLSSTLVQLLFRWKSEVLSLDAA